MLKPDIITVEGFDARNFGDMMMAVASGHIGHDASRSSQILYRCRENPAFLLGTASRLFRKLSGKLGVVSRAGHRVDARSIVDPRVKAILYCNGYIFGGHWPQEWMQDLLTDFSEAKQNGKKIILMPQSFGPFDQPWQPKMMNEIALTVDLIFARDEKSFGYLKSVLDETSNIHSVCDYTPILNNEDSYQPSNNRIIVIPNIKICEMFGEEALEIYINSLQEIAGQVQRNTGATPVLVEHTIGKDDRILRTLESRGFVRQPRSKNALEARRFIGSSRFVLSSRFHGVMNGLSQGVPTIAIGWSHKYDELMRRFGCERFNLRYDIPDTESIVSEFMDAEQDLRRDLPNKTREVRLLLDNELVAPLKNAFA